MKHLTLIRHAESLANIGGVTMAHADIPLSERGQRQAALLAQLLPAPASTVLVSPMIRTQLTAAPYCARQDLQPRQWPALAEFSVICPSRIAGFSGEQRKPLVEAYWRDSAPQSRLGPGADTFAEFQARVREFMTQLPELPDGSLIFGHGIWFALLLWCLLGYETQHREAMQQFRRFQLALPMPNCAVLHLVGEGEYWSVKADVGIADQIAALA